jgi:hypothetical protein
MFHSNLRVLKLSICCSLALMVSCFLSPTDKGTDNSKPLPGTTSNGYFYISEPGLGKAYLIGVYDTMQWTSGSSVSGAYVSIYLFKDTTWVSTITSGTTNTGLYTYYMPNVGTGSKYHVKIRSATDTTQYDFGSYFSIYSNYYGTYSIQNPTDSSAWAAGNTYTIQWQSTGSPGTYVNIQLCNDSTLYSTITSYISNSGTYSWTVPGTILTGSNYRIKISSYSDAGIYGYSKKFAIAGITPDSYEPDNSRDSASTLVLGTPQQHTITLNDTDWVKFSADSGSLYIIQDSGVTAFRTYTYLYFGTDVSYTDYNYSLSTGAMQWQWTCTKTGTYYAKNFAYYSGYGGAYTFKITKYDPLTSVKFTSPDSVTTWAAGSSYAVSWTPNTTVFGSYVNLYLYKGNLLITTLVTDATNSGSYTATFPTGLASGSDYRIKIANYSNTVLTGFSSYFTVSGVSPDAYENDNVRDSAKALTLGAVQQHTITLSDTDWVKFYADSGSLYIIQDSGAAGFRTYTYLYYGTDVSSTNYNYSGSTGTLLWQWSCLKSGTYYLKNYAYYSGYGGAYTFVVSKYDPQTSVKFTSPDSTTSWAAGSSYTISWTPNTMVFGSYVNLYLYKGNQLVYSIYSSGASNTGSYTWTIPSGFATGSDYRIKIASYSSTAIAGFSPYFTISGMTPDGYEFDNMRDSAKTLTLGTAQQHNLTYSDTDWVKFSADSGKRYVVSSIGTSGFMVYAYLYNGAATNYTTYFYSTSSNGVLYNSPWTCTIPGTYYLRITPYSSGTTGSYSFKVIKFDSTTAANFTNPLSGATWSSGSTYTISWSADSALFSNYVYLYLYKGSQYVVSIASDISNTGTYSWTVPAGYLTGSDYRIEIMSYSNSSIYGYSQPFTISGVAIDAYEYDDTAGAAKAITTDGTAQSRTLSRSDIDWIKFTAEKDSLYFIQSLGGTTVYMYEYLYSSPTGTYLASQYGYSPKILWTCPASGTYFVKVIPYSTSYYGSYQLVVKKYSLASSVSFINPTATAAWITGSTYQIQWTADTALFGASVRLQLTVDTASFYSIISSTTNSGTYSWIPPAGLATGSQYHIKLSNYTYANIAGLSPAFSISGINPDAYEPDDSTLTAHIISTTGAVESHTISMYDKDWYKFSGTANLLYAIKSSGAIKPALYLYSTDAATLLTSVNTGNTDTSASVVWFCPASGTYYFRAISSYYGSYQTSVNSYDTASYKLTVTSPAAGDTVTMGQTKNILWTNTVSVGGYVDIFLYNGSGIVGTIIANTANSGSYTWTVPSTYTAGSGYYVRVISRFTSNIFGNSGVFSIR